MIAAALQNACHILCLGAHSDDIEIGCGGTLLALARQRPDLAVTWVVFSGQGARAKEARASGECFLEGIKKKKILLKKFRVSFFPYEGEAIKNYFEELKRLPQPDVIFTHYRDDRHQDHRVLSDLAWNTWRNHLIFEYEIPKYDGDLGAPNVFNPIPEDVCREKAENLCRFFRTQGNKHWFAPETFLGLMRLRGMECASPTSYAEAFYCRKMLLSL
jgi:LmbE family N-acetylglucosaminyl deacetylase